MKKFFQKFIPTILLAGYISILLTDIFHIHDTELIFPENVITSSESRGIFHIQSECTVHLAAKVISVYDLFSGAVNAIPDNKILFCYKDRTRQTFILFNQEVLNLRAPPAV